MTNLGMLYNTALCNHVLMNGYFLISNSYTLRNVYVQSTTNPSMFYETTMKNHNLDYYTLYHDENTPFFKNYLTMMPIDFSNINL